jgi:hypothetical protein
MMEFMLSLSPPMQLFEYLIIIFWDPQNEICMLNNVRICLKQDIHYLYQNKKTKTFVNVGCFPSLNSRDFMFFSLVPI